MVIRKIVEIDEEKCDGCGLCVPGCAEGALQIVDGKARLVSEVYCDGLGECLGECPRGAIRMVEREAHEFDEAAVQRHLATSTAAAKTTPCASTCPGSRAQTFSLPMANSRQASASRPSEARPAGIESHSSLGHWPIQLRLISPGAPFLRNAHLLLVADCVPAALPDFQNLIRGRAIALACPKLDDAREHVGRLAAILAEAPIESISVVHMEVPCCSGLRHIAQAAMEASGRQVPLADITVSIRGDVLGLPKHH